MRAARLPRLGALQPRAAPRAAPQRVACAAAAAGARDDIVLRSLSVNGEVAVLVAVATQLVGEAQLRHRSAPTATAALGRTLVAGLLLAGFRGDDEQVQISFNGGGPLGKMTVLADSRCRVKGFVQCPEADPPLREDGKLNVGAAVGQAGVLSVVRMHPSLPPFSGTVELQTGEVGDDVCHYLRVSEQQPACAVGLGVKIARDLSVAASGGFMVQCLPFVSDETVAILERNLTAMPPITQLLSEGLDAQAITERILDGLGASRGAQTRLPTYGPCEENLLRAKMERAVLALGAEEMQRIHGEQGKLEVTCEYCVTTIELDAEALLAAAASSA
jgi:molecular chaperone Hsp33